MASAKKPTSRRTTKAAPKAKAAPKGKARPQAKTYDIEIDGNRLVGQLTKAGLDPSKLDLPAILGRPRGLDITELQSRLRSASLAKAGDWHFHFHVGLAPTKPPQP